ncbi:molybdopterin-dependent oxidoreductase [Microbacterium yannicii]|uniref:Molybdopterin-dependent oxidoreductase n=1 Tax=Microbacterium yannicii TaxID=671622 RepID=A0ABP9M204_9MICO|nr:molybdopterin-dependent oxidoreductase [Microbacterium yannicii]MCO5954273.1 molybdopterin-dependent oxidoreductase [Microbacterium yannicii]
MAANRSDGRAPALLTWIAGVAAVLLAAGLGELAAMVVSPSSSPVAAIGAALIDVAPPWAKDSAIALFGTADKIALVVGIALAMLVLAALAGWLQARRPPWGVVVIALFGITGAIVAATRPGAGALAWLPSLVAGAVGAVSLWLLVRLLQPARADTARTAPAPAPAPAPAERASAEPATPVAGPTSDLRATQPPSRRAFFAWAGAAAAAGILAAVVGVRGATSATVAAVRRAVKLPQPAAAASAVPAGAELDIAGLTDVVTPNAQFYRIDTALIVPEVDTADWRLRVHGMVANEFELTWDELLALPLEESWTTLTCVSNEVGGNLIGNARWLGYPLRELLARARPTADADMVLSRSIDGFTASTPLEALTDDRNAILAVGMNGEPLPLEHGFPVRMVVPGLYGYVSATKWVVDLEVTRFDRATAYWTTRGWSERGPIKLQSRIDVPRKGQGLKAGEVVIAGVAWQQHVGVEGVEVRIDEGEWMPAALAAAISDDTWVQWSVPWTATPGDHVIQCRATSTTGEVQTEDTAPPAPDGASGWHWRTVSVFD